MVTVANQTSPIDITVVNDPTLTYVSLGIALATAIVLGLTVYMQKRQLNIMQKQVSLVENEMQVRLRPWLGIVGEVKPTFVFLKNGNLTYDEYAKMSPAQIDESEIEYFHYEIHVKNFGSSPARDTNYVFALSAEPLTKDNLPTINVPRKILGALMPNAERMIAFKLSRNEYKTVNYENHHVYLLLHLEYSYADNRKASTGYTLKLRKGGIELTDNWL